jgi:hypothetical protein
MAAIRASILTGSVAVVAAVPPATHPFQLAADSVAPATTIHQRLAEPIWQVVVVVAAAEKQAVMVLAVQAGRVRLVPTTGRRARPVVSAQIAAM